MKLNSTIAILTAILVQAVLTEVVHAQVAPTPTTALYYNHHDRLLQIEDLTGVNLNERLVQDVSHFPIPRMTTQTNEKLGDPCPAETALQPMSRHASYAIYYGVNLTADSGEFARPIGIEWLKDVTGRNISCQQIKNDTPCAAGYRCLTGCVGCPSWCCVR